MVRLTALLTLLLAGCTPGLWLDDGYYGCEEGACPSVAPYCWSDLHCHRAAEGSVDGGSNDAATDDAAADASTSAPSFVACSTSAPCAGDEICTPLGVCSRACTTSNAAAVCGDLQCSASELPSGQAYCRPSCDAGCPGGSICGMTRSLAGAIAEDGACVAPFEMFETARHYEDCDNDAACGPYTCTGRVSASQPGICLLPCETDGVGCPSEMVCVQTAGAPMPTACLFTCTVAGAEEECIPQHMAPARCEERTSSAGPRRVCIDADGL